MIEDELSLGLVGRVMKTQHSAVAWLDDRHGEGAKIPLVDRHKSVPSKGGIRTAT